MPASTAPPDRRADQLIERARIAYVKAGGREQPGESVVVDVDGFTTITLRNINGVLAVYQLHGDMLQRQAVVTATVDQLFDAAFAGPRDPRSAEYRAGARTALEFRIEGLPIRRPYRAGTAADDAFYAGIAEGHAIWRAAQAEAAGAA
ncbi:hypothetical protein ACEN9F_30490 [Duganella sp. CT11-25]|uniref:hypothetical protein n=1 Tax=unclassified Duganella TaxID=2636909 RepID=UPI0039AFB3D1